MFRDACLCPGKYRQRRRHRPGPIGCQHSRLASNSSISELEQKTSRKTSREGVFLLPGVIPGLYTLQIDQEGFATTQLNGISLNVGDTKNLLIRLKIGPVTESVNVDASGLTLNTSSASVSTLVDRRFVGDIPLNGRSFQDLISMTPGIVTQSPQAAGEGMGSQGDFGVKRTKTRSKPILCGRGIGEHQLRCNRRSATTDRHRVCRRLHRFGDNSDSGFNRCFAGVSSSELDLFG